MNKKHAALIFAGFVILGVVASRVVNAQYTPRTLEGGVAPTELTVSGASYALTPSISEDVYALSAAAATTVTVANATQIGQRLTILSVGADTVTVLDQTNIEGTGALVLDSWDSAQWIAGNSTNWVQTSTSNN